MALKFDKYKEAIFNFIENGSGNAVINAVAGSGKTFTITHALKLIPKNEKVLFIAFNKHIKEELSSKLSKMGITNVDVMTVHSYGSRALYGAYKSILDNDKVYKIVKDLYHTWNIPSDLENGYFGRVVRLVELAKLTLSETVAELTEIAYQHDIEIVNSEVENALQVKKVSDTNIRVHDFNDMLYVPVKRKLNTKKFDWVFIDECQDLSVCAQELMKKAVARNGRFIAVGDPNQCIYGFAGADVNSFNKLKNIPNTVELPLSMTYRCSKVVTELAQKIVPEISPLPDAPLGSINNNGKLENIKSSDLILSRVNRPLVKLCLAFLSEGKKAFIKGRDIGKNIANMLKKTKKQDIGEALEALRFQREKMIKKMIYQKGITRGEAIETNAIQNFDDKVGAIEVLAGELISVKAVIDKIYQIFADEKDGICLSSVHRAKGLEADRVFIVEPQTLPAPWAKQDWEMEQEKNIEYVAYTRAKKDLIFIPQTEFTTYEIK